MSGLTSGESFLKSILDLWRNRTSNGVISKSYTLTGTPTGLANFKCKAVQLLASSTVILGNGDSITYAGGLLPCNNANEILVSGSGTLTYLIFI
jgi:hypothetical protein